MVHVDCGARVSSQIVPTVSACHVRFESVGAIPNDSVGVSSRAAYISLNFESPAFVHHIHGLEDVLPPSYREPVHYHFVLQTAAEHLLRVSRVPTFSIRCAMASSVSRGLTWFGVSPSTTHISSFVRPSSPALRMQFRTRSCAWVNLSLMLSNAARDSGLSR